MEEVQNTQFRQSKYNAAIAQLYRLDDLWKEAHKHGKEVSYIKWNEVLDRVWCELRTDVYSDQKIKNQMEEFDKKLMNNYLYTINETLKIEKPVQYAKIINNLKRILIEKEAYLRYLQNSQGKGSAYEEDIEDYID